MSRTFTLQRDVDETGVSGTGAVAYGVIFPDGCVAMRWAGPLSSTACYDSIEDVIAIHGHQGKTRIVMDGDGGRYCPPSPDGRHQWDANSEMQYVCMLCGHRPDPSPPDADPALREAGIQHDGDPQWEEPGTGPGRSGYEGASTINIGDVVRAARRAPGSFRRTWAQGEPVDAGPDTSAAFMAAFQVPKEKE